VFKIAAATAFACTILLISDPSDARARFRMPSSTPKPAAAMPLKPAATAPAPSRSSGVGVGLYVPIGSRPAAASSNGSPQRAVDNPANGPLQYDPTLASAEAKPAAASTELAAAPSTECSVVAKEPAPAKEKEAVAAQEPAKAEPARSRSAFLVPVANKHKRAAPQAATVCYVQRDGSCTPY